jgi:hypothetical protein
LTDFPLKRPADADITAPVFDAFPCRIQNQPRTAGPHDYSP